MCQLLGMNCNVPTDICFSFEGFQARGGLTDHHRDGFGIAFFEGEGCRTFMDSKATIESPVAELIRQYPIQSKNVIAHIRKATQGKVELQNCHPFQRELWGRYWIFAHNGNLENFQPEGLSHYQPVGQTDSERAFCYLLDRLKRAYPLGHPGDLEIYAFLQEAVKEIAAYGLFNFLLSNGDFLIAHCANNLHYIVRQAPFGQAHLIDQDLSIDFREVTNEQDRVAVIASFPLTDNEVWMALQPGQLVLFKEGAVIS